MDTFLQDLRYALRGLLRDRSFTLVAVLTLALGIGANSAVFSVVNGVLLRPLPFPEPDQLVRIYDNFHANGLKQIPVSVLEYRDFRERAKTLASTAIFTDTDVTLTGQDMPERLRAVSATASFFPTLGVTPFLGRSFTEEEETPGRERVVVLSHRLWRGRFGANPHILGTTLTLNGQPFTVVGVLPERFEYPQDRDLYIPYVPPENLLLPDFRSWRFLDVVGRLKPGVTPDAAQRDMDRVAAEIQQSFPDKYRQGSGWAISVITLQEEVVGEVRKTLWVLLGAVSFVLLIACINVANLLLVRATARSRELSIRAALGAVRRRLVRQFFTESLLLAVSGGVLGLLLAMWGLDALLALTRDNLPRVADVHLDGGVMLFTLGTSVLTGLLFGLIPALQASRVDLQGAMRRGPQGKGGRGSGAMRALLVVSQVALALVLLAGAGLFLRSFMALRAVDAGFESQGILTARLSLASDRYREPVQRAAMMSTFLERVRAVPGVEMAGLTSVLPLRGRVSWGYELEGEEPSAPGVKHPSMEYRAVSADYHKALRIPLLRGRLLADSDAFGAPLAVVINETMARLAFPGKDPLGQRMRLRSNDHDAPWATVVGIVKDVREWGLDVPARATSYFSVTQQAPTSTYLVVRTQQRPESLLASLQAELRTVDRDLPLYSVTPMDAVVDDSVAQRRFSMVLLMLFAGVAVVLASLGIYGVISYTVTQRTRELGIRMALGARQVDVLGLVVGQGMRLTLVGVAVGLLLSLGLGRLLSALLYGVQAHDPLTFAGVGALLAGVALLASWLPARRAAKVDPALTLRAE
ncbi:ABC transporter permease [Hyalangium versicolor]|uniref:ABC transporter permease n=1 Tax=Hyalangium versicolor TaxID=2861190 RepID=UPI001CCD3A00|nr:ABC transporter permease [Hyalangium versicolor]